MIVLYANVKKKLGNLYNGIKIGFKTFYFIIFLSAILANLLLGT